MILDGFKNISVYSPMISNLQNAMDFVNNLGELSVGRYEFNGGFLMVQEGTTNLIDECNFETHEKYIDVQYVVEGSEIMVWADRKNLDCTIRYDEKKDATFYKGNGTAIEINAGMSYILFPSDGHKACCHVNNPKVYKKYVIKLWI